MLLMKFEEFYSLELDKLFFFLFFNYQYFITHSCFLELTKFYNFLYPFYFTLIYLVFDLRKFSITPRCLSSGGKIPEDLLEFRRFVGTWPHRRDYK